MEKKGASKRELIKKIRKEIAKYFCRLISGKEVLFLMLT